MALTVSGCGGSGGDDGGCGDGTCRAPETAASCPEDCDKQGNGTCNNHICEPGEATTCPQDCITCGNGHCDAGETPTSCPQDCNTCGNGHCDAGETPTSCPQDCNTCGNGQCDAGETSTSCPQDCPTCGNGRCDANETPSSCPRDCGTCGNGVCDANETPSSCPRDCGTCGNGVCDANETPSSCPRDCGTCGNGRCDANETASSCPQDCTATLVTQNSSTHEILQLFVYPCGTTNEGVNQLGPKTIPVGARFTLSKIPPGCYLFHATASTVFWRTTANVILIDGLTYTWTLLNGPIANVTVSDLPGAADQPTSEATSFVAPR